VIVVVSISESFGWLFGLGFKHCSFSVECGFRQQEEQARMP
jgi:hypothetical protein